MTRPIPWRRIVGFAVVVLGCLYAVAWWFAQPSKVGEYGSLGDAFAPLTVLASAIGLIGALVSVDLQRKELALQRQEMKESRAELRRTAEAQESLAKSQERLANAQRDAVREAAASRLAMHGLTVALLEASLSSLETVNHDNTPGGRMIADIMNEGSARERIEKRLEVETRNHEQLRRILEKGGR